MKNNNEFDWKTQLKYFDERRDVIILNDSTDAVIFSVKQFIQLAQSAIADHNVFTVALSGGSTPNAIFKALSQAPYKDKVDWNKVFVFWSDERSVPPNHAESNYHMAMQAGLSSLPIPKEHIFRMEAEKDVEEKARQYEQNIQRIIPSKKFDLIMLGMGEDGHTASLFPLTKGLHVKDRLAIANYVPQKETWRMTLTYDCIQLAKCVVIYVMGKNKAEMVAKALSTPNNPDLIPIQRIGSAQNKAIWILDKEAGESIIPKIANG